MPVDVVGEDLVLGRVSRDAALHRFHDLLFQFVAERPAYPALHLLAQVLVKDGGEHKGRGLVILREHDGDRLAVVVHKELVIADGVAHNVGLLVVGGSKESRYKCRDDLRFREGMDQVGGHDDAAVEDPTGVKQDAVLDGLFGGIDRDRFAEERIGWCLGYFFVRHRIMLKRIRSGGSTPAARQPKAAGDRNLLGEMLKGSRLKSDTTQKIRDVKARKP